MRHGMGQGEMQSDGAVADKQSMQAITLHGQGEPAIHCRHAFHTLSIIHVQKRSDTAALR